MEWKTTSLISSRMWGCVQTSTQIFTCSSALPLKSGVALVSAAVRVKETERADADDFEADGATHGCGQGREEICLTLV